jgi:ATP-dependent exoDNAse (exonuclease V) beta subunit
VADLAGRNEYMSCGEFAQHLQNMRTLQVKQSNAPLETTNAVKLMTVHRAKGLEFPAVIMPVLRTSFKKTSSKLIFHHQYGVAINTQRTKDDPMPLWYRLGSLMNQDMELAEKKRLLYVAMTRARDYLGIFIPDSERRSESFAEWLQSLLNISASNFEGNANHIETRTVPGAEATFLLKRIERMPLGAHAPCVPQSRRDACAPKTDTL